MRTRLWLFLCLGSIAACQCLEPVAEDDGGTPSDAGVDAGPGDGGLDAGADAGAFDCLTAADCPLPAQLPFCGPARPACVNHRCLIECGAPDAGRTCTHDAGSECLTCDGVAECVTCRSFTCRFDPQPVVGSCPPPFDDFQAFFVDPFSGRCGAAITRDGGLWGVWYGALREGQLLEIPALGGTCLASGLATQIPRAVISCPACTFISEGCE